MYIYKTFLSVPEQDKGIRIYQNGQMIECYRQDNYLKAKDNMFTYTWYFEDEFFTRRLHKGTVSVHLSVQDSQFFRDILDALAIQDINYENAGTEELKTTIKQQIHLINEQTRKIAELKKDIQNMLTMGID